MVVRSHQSTISLTHLRRIELSEARTRPLSTFCGSINQLALSRWLRWAQQCSTAPLSLSGDCCRERLVRTSQRSAAHPQLSRLQSSSTLPGANGSSRHHTCRLKALSHRRCATQRHDAVQYASAGKSRHKGCLKNSYQRMERNTYISRIEVDICFDRNLWPWEIELMAMHKSVLYRT